MESEAHPDGGVFPRGVFSRDDGLVLFVDKPDFAVFIYGGFPFREVPCVFVLCRDDDLAGIDVNEPSLPIFIAEDDHRVFRYAGGDPFPFWGDIFPFVVII